LFIQTFTNKWIQ